MIGLALSLVAQMPLPAEGTPLELELYAPEVEDVDYEVALAADDDEGMEGVLAEALEREGMPPKERAKMRPLRKKFLYPIIMKGAELKIARMEFRALLVTGEFSPKELQKAQKRVGKARAEISRLTVDGLIALRKAVGPERFREMMAAGHRPCMRGPKMKMMKMMMKNKCKKMMEGEGPEERMRDE